MIEHSSEEGDLVFDPFAGSGAICRAAEGMGREWLGVEVDGRWVGDNQKENQQK
ncbi:hypothetical protein HNV12_01790 [Methanococcoides sp. SA1]|nr:hypothetical protein [Methanococcoides sp. SA1]